MLAEKFSSSFSTQLDGQEIYIKKSKTAIDHFTAASVNKIQTATNSL